MNLVDKKRLAFVHLLYSDDEADFAHWYKIATERGNGTGIFHFLRDHELKAIKMLGIKPEDFTGDMLPGYLSKSPLLPRTCKTCGREFWGTMGKNYCSKECKENRKKRFERVCPICKKTFTTFLEQKNYCSYKHAHIANNKRPYAYYSANLDQLVAQCPVCKKEHILNCNGMFCSVNCKKIFENGDMKK